MNVIHFENVSKTYNERIALDNFSMSVQPGETKVILGGSGSGKSTILKIILGLVRPDSGQVYVEGDEITELQEEKLMEIRKKIGIVFQEGALFDSLTVKENVAYRIMDSKEYTREQIESWVTHLLSFVGLEDTIDKMPSELSGGMRRRVAIARALMGSPKIMLYDEPTAGLDPITSRITCELIMRLRDLENVTGILITNDLRTIQALSAEVSTQSPDGSIAFKMVDPEQLLEKNRFMMLKGGRIIYEGEDPNLEGNDSCIHDFLA